MTALLKRLELRITTLEKTASTSTAAAPAPAKSKVQDDDDDDGVDLFGSDSEVRVKCVFGQILLFVITIN